MRVLGLRLSHLAKTTRLAGYVHQGRVWCKACVRDKYAWWGYRWSAECALDGEARRQGFDRDDESSFSDADFPKTLFRDALTGGEACGCGNQVT